MEALIFTDILSLTGP